MNTERVKQFFRDWGIAVFLVLGGIMQLSLFVEEQRVIAAKDRIARDRASIAETRDRVRSIEARLLANDVPDRLTRIESGMSQAVRENQEAIRSLDARQQQVAATIEEVLGVPREEIVPPGPLVPGPK